MQIILYDTEFTAWEGSLQRNWSNPDEHREIIQLSALKVRISDRVQVEEQISLFVKPSINQQLSNYIQELTGIEQDQVDQGVSASELFKKLQDFSNSGSIPMYSWGDDLHILEETASLNQLSIHWVQSHNLQPLFAPFKIPAHFTSGNLYQFFELPLSLREHNADDDTQSLYECLKHIHQNHSKEVSQFFSSALAST